MLIFKKLSDLPIFDKSASLSIGNFDGLHRGHQHLISHLKKTKHLSTLVTYSTPLASKSPLSIFSLREKIRLFEMLHIDLLLVLSFEEISSLPYDTFLDQIGAHFPSIRLVLGKGSFFGKNREGDEEKVAAYAAKKPLSAEYLCKICEEGEIISSSWVRQAIEQGDLSLLQRLLGRPFSYSFPPPFSHKFFTSPYSSQFSLELSLTTLCPLPKGSYDVYVETQSSGFSTVATLTEDHLHLIIPSSHFSEEAPLSVVFCSKRTKDSFFSPNKIFKDLYV